MMPDICLNCKKEYVIHAGVFCSIRCAYEWVTSDLRFRQVNSKSYEPYVDKINIWWKEVNEIWNDVKLIDIVEVENAR